jgi:carbamate kinase
MWQSSVVPADSQFVRLIVALGGNALLLRGEPTDIETQRANTSMAVSAIAQLARSHQVVVTHGNGRQVGLLALHVEQTGGVAAIGARHDAARLLSGERGTRVIAGSYHRRPS